MLAAALCLSMTACGDTSYAVKSGNITIPTGVYILSKIDAVSQAASHEDFDKEKENVLENVIEDQKIELWVDEKATERLKEFLYIEQKFAESGLTLSEEDKAAAKHTSESIWPFYKENYEKIGIAESSYTARIENSYKSSALFLQQYGKGGAEEIPEADLKAELKNNYATVQMISFGTKESDGTAMTDANKQVVENEAKSYLERAKKGEDIVTLINAKKEADATEESPANIDETADYKETVHNGDASSSGVVSAELSKQVFEKAEIGTPALLSDDSGYYVVLRTASDTSDENFKAMNDQLRFDLKGDAYTDAVTAAAKEIDMELNPNVVSTFSAKKLLGA